MNQLRVNMLIVPWLLLAPAALSDESAYSPLALPDETVPETLSLSITDSDRDRTIPLRVYLPPAADEPTPAPVVLFSHGLGGSCENNPYLGNHWAARGYAAVFMQHVGSDTSVWKDKPLLERMQAMKDAASAENFFLRVKDVPVVLDQLERWNAAEEHPLAGRLDLEKVGMSGHSFGAVTTQAVSGQNYGRLFSCTDARIKAAVAFSPSRPRLGDPGKAFGKVKIPWMLMTGTRDDSIISDASAESRLAVFPALPPGGKYELVLYNAEHSAFADRALPGDSEKRNPNHHRVIVALSTAFWDAYLRGNEDARAWLDGDGPRSVLEEEDRWQKK
jgi:predicted dienelactone hydrolase